MINHCGLTRMETDMIQFIAALYELVITESPSGTTPSGTIILGSIGKELPLLTEVSIIAQLTIAGYDAESTYDERYNSTVIYVRG